MLIVILRPLQLRDTYRLLKIEQPTHEQLVVTDDGTECVDIVAQNPGNNHTRNDRYSEAQLGDVLAMIDASNGPKSQVIQNRISVRFRVCAKTFVVVIRF